jgi:UDP-N-acetylglucosamine transferase subunit ALG13
MIFVSVGTHEDPFDRMLEAVRDLDLDEPLVIQYGPSAVRCEGATEFEFLSFDEMVGYIKSARAVIMHAGVGSVMVSLANGKRPIVMARLHEHGEHVDDHQLELARRLHAYGLVQLVGNAAELGEALAVADDSASGQMQGIAWLGDDLREYVAGRGAVPAVR